MADPAQKPPAQGGLQIPPEVQEKFGELIELIKASESMNDEERQYWINILPIMTPEQIQNLRDILENERRQLQEIDKKYSKEIDQAGQQELIARTASERTTRRKERLSKEAQALASENADTQNILKQIEKQ